MSILKVTFLNKYPLSFLIRNLVPVFLEIGSDDITVGRSYKLIDGSGFVTRRKRRKIIRFRHFPENDEDNYCREQLMLFIPWRNEEMELIDCDVKDTYLRKKDMIIDNSAPYYYSRDIDEGVLAQYISEIEEQTENETNEEYVQNDMEVEDDLAYAESILTGKRVPVTKVATFLKPGLLQDAEYFTLMRSLNSKQRKIVMHVLHELKCVNDPFHIFLTGGAGTKSNVT